MFGKRILILIPHPDDEVVGCGGAIVRGQTDGARIFGAYLTTGVYPKAKEWPWLKFRYEKKVARRLAEAKQAAQFLSIEPLWLQTIPSRTLMEHLEETRQKISILLREKNIDTLWTPSYEGGHPDHDTANFLAAAFLGQIPVWEFSEYHFHEGKVGRNRFIRPNGGELTLSLSPKEQCQKSDALRIYRSEKFNLGVISPSLRQEVFRPLGRYDYTSPPHPGRVFYERFRLFAFHPRVCTTSAKSLSERLHHYMTEQKN